MALSLLPAVVHRFGFAGVVATAAVACGSNSEQASADPAGQQDGGQANGTRSFDPNGFDRTCSVDTDCVLVEPMTDCRSCCVYAEAVRNTPMLSSALAEVRCELREVCTVLCRDVAVCVKGTCEKRAAPTDAGADGG